MGGAEAFPYPPDDPVHVRSMAATLGTLRTSLDRSYRRVHTHWATLSDRWLGVAGPRATGEILNLGSALQLSAGGLDGLDVAARTYAQVIETARVAIDHLRTSYDQIDFTADTNMADDRALSRLVDRYQDVLEEVRAAGKRLGGRLLQAAGTWSPAPASANPGLARLKALEQLRFMAPDDGPAITRLPGLVLIDTGSGNDVVTVQIDPATGEVVVTVNGVEHRFTAAEANGLVIRTGRGKDVVEVAAGTRIGFTILTESDDDRVVGGSGDDLISSGYGNDDVNGGRGSDAVDLGEGNDRYRDAPTPGWLGALFTPLLGPGGNDAVAGSGGDDEIRTGEGDDHVDGGSGNDRVGTGRGDDTVDGGQGDDRIYGGDGDDKVRGGGGKDYLEGGAGNNRIDGGTGDDLVSGGRGDDVLDGGSGNDVVNTGAGRDSVTDIAGSNTVYAKAGDIVTGNGTTTRVTIEIAEIPRNITIEGSPEFVDHAQADLDLLAASPTGQKMLARLGSGPGTVVIRELTPEQAKTAAGLAWARPATGASPPTTRTATASTCCTTSSTTRTPGCTTSACPAGTPAATPGTCRRGSTPTTTGLSPSASSTRTVTVASTPRTWTATTTARSTATTAGSATSNARLSASASTRTPTPTPRTSRPARWSTSPRASTRTTSTGSSTSPVRTTTTGEMGNRCRDLALGAGWKNDRSYETYHHRSSGGQAHDAWGHSPVPAVD